MTFPGKQWRLLILVSSLAIIVISLAYPRLVSSMYYLPVETALQGHWSGLPIRPNQYAALIEKSEQAISVLDDARYRRGLGWLYYLQALDFHPGSPQGQASLAHARNAFETSLAQAPANPAIWLSLAWSYAYLGLDDTKVVQALAMSLQTGRAERYLLLNRLDLALRYAAHLQTENLALLHDQVELAWQLYQHELLKKMSGSETHWHNLPDLIQTSNPELAQEIRDKA